MALLLRLLPPNYSMLIVGQSSYCETCRTGQPGLKKTLINAANRQSVWCQTHSAVCESLFFTSTVSTFGVTKCPRVIPTEGELLTLSATIQIQCACGWTAHVSAELAGKHLRCRECRGVIEAPALPTAVALSKVSSTQEASKQATPKRRTSAPAAPQPLNDSVVKSRVVLSKRVNRKNSGTTQRRQQGDSAGSIANKGNKATRGHRSARRSPARSKRRVAGPPAYDDDYGPEFDESSFMNPSPSSTTRRRHRRSSGSGGIPKWAIVLSGVLTAFAALAYGGYTLIRSDAFARIAGQQFRSIQPVYDVVSSKTTRQIQMSVKMSVPVSLKIESHLVLVRDATAQNIQLTLIAARIDQFARSGALTPEVSDLITSSQVLSRSQGITQELALKDAPETVADYIGLFGTPAVNIPRDSNEMRKPISLVADSKQSQKSRQAFNTSVFIDAPFATNVEWWDVERTLSGANGGDIQGTIRYEKIGSTDDEITVSLSGTLSAKKFKAPTGLTLARVDLKVSGQHVYSTAMNDWQSGTCVIEFTTPLAGNGSTIEDDFKLNLSFQTRAFEGKADTLLKMEDFPSSDPMQELRDLAEGMRNE